LHTVTEYPHNNGEFKCSSSTCLGLNLFESVLLTFSFHMWSN